MNWKVLIASGVLFFSTICFAQDEHLAPGCSVDALTADGQLEEHPILDFFQQFQKDIALSRSYMPIIKDKCFIRWDESQRLEDVLYVDVRGEENFHKINIPDSINIPEHHISTRNFLKKKQVVLVAGGYRYFDLVNLCKSLPYDGFEYVKVLEGGLSHWQSLTLKKDYRSQLQRLTPQEFYAASHKNLWLVLDLTGEKRDRPENVIPFLPNTKVKDFRDEVRKYVASIKKEKGVHPSLLVVNGRGKDEKGLLDILGVSIRSYMYLLDGGVAAYNDYSRVIAATRNKKLRNTHKVEAVCGI